MFSRIAVIFQFAPLIQISQTFQNRVKDLKVGGRGASWGAEAQVGGQRRKLGGRGASWGAEAQVGGQRRKLGGRGASWGAEAQVAVLRFSHHHLKYTLLTYRI